MNVEREFLRGAVPVHVLYHAGQGEIHGAWLATELTRHGYRISPGTLYPLLHRMEAAELLTSREETAGGRVRRLYRATAAGMTALAAARSVLTELVGEVLPAASEQAASTSDTGYTLRSIGRVESPLTDAGSAPKQGDEGAPDAWLVFEPDVAAGLADLHAGSEVMVLTWLDRASRDVLAVHPRGDPARKLTGVFSTRSPARPNPIGLHRVAIASTDGVRIRVRNLEALDGTPIVDVKPVIGAVAER